MEYRTDPDYLAEQAELREDEEAERQETIRELMDDGLTRKQAEKVCCG